MAHETVLALDTSTLTGSVALVQRSGDRCRTVAARESGVDNHSDRLIALIDDALAEAGARLADVAGIAVGAGPGSFTGLRIGMATAKGLCFAADKPLWVVSSLAALALDAREHAGAGGIVAPVVDARRQEVFACLFDTGAPALRPLSRERVLAPEELADMIGEVLGQDAGSGVRLVGDGAVLYADRLGAAGVIDASCRATPSAASVGALALDREPTRELAAAAPVYIRPSEAERRHPHGSPGGTFARRRGAGENA